MYGMASARRVISRLMPMDTIGAPKRKKRLREGQTLSPESLAQAVQRHTFDGIVVQAHYGSQVLGVTEVWEADGLLHIAVDTTSPAGDAPPAGAPASSPAPGDVPA